MATDEWQKAETIKKEYWKNMKPGDEKIGFMVRGEAGEYKGKATMQYVIMTDEGECYMPNHTVLNNQLVTVKTGQKVKIVYQGTAEKTKKGKAAAELYDVFVSSQTNLNDVKPPITDPAAKILNLLKKAPAGLQDGAFWDMASQEVTPMSDCIKAVDRLKAEGKVIQTNGTWQATV